MEIISYDILINRIKNYQKDTASLSKISDAYSYAVTTQENYFRKDNSPLIEHSLWVAYILADLNVDETTIIAALVHESVITCKIKIDEINKLFGSDVALIVDNLSKINKLKLNDDSEGSSIYLRKILVGLSEDVRVLFIKLADRLHNMRTIYVEKNKEQKDKLLETKNVLIPIAHRLGINSIKSELEDLWLKYSKPDIYQDILDKLNNSRDALNILIDEMKESLSEIMLEHNIPFKIKGRVKSVHSIYEKLMKGRKFSDIYDILALRLILDQESDCYLAVGLIHAKYRPIPKRFKDFIAMPKENMYQSLHTTVFGPDGYLFEIQLRTHEMDEIAEHGIASHWSYKEHGTLKTQNIMEQKLELFRSLIDVSTESSETEFNESVNNEFLSDLIYVFTPKGDVVELPENSTPIDFAYRIHSQVGDTTTGAIVNGQIVPLTYKLQDNDIIQIKTTANSYPKKEWINIVKTSQAKSKIKAYFSKKDREDYIVKGKELIDKELKHSHLQYQEIFNDDNIKTILNELSLKDFEEVLFNIGSLRYTANYIISIIHGDKKSVQDVLLDRVLNHQVNSKSNDYKNDVIVSGIDNIKINFSSCCNPVLGDDIIGYVTKGNGVSIHRKDCYNVRDLKERLIDVAWNNNLDKYYYVTLLIKIDEFESPIVDIITKSSIRNIIVEGFNKNNTNNNMNYTLTIKVKNKEDLELFITDIKSIKGVIAVSRGNN